MSRYLEFAQEFAQGVIEIQDFHEKEKQKERLLISKGSEILRDVRSIGHDYIYAMRSKRLIITGDDKEGSFTMTVSYRSGSSSTLQFLNTSSGYVEAKSAEAFLSEDNTHSVEIHEFEDEKIHRIFEFFLKEGLRLSRSQGGVSFRA